MQVIYEIINHWNRENGINPWRYIGSDYNNNPEYFGSSKPLKNDIKKLGEEFFEKRILISFPDFLNVTVKKLQDIEHKILKCLNCAENITYYNKVNGIPIFRKDYYTTISPKPSFEEFEKSIEELGYNCTCEKYDITIKTLNKWVDEYGKEYDITKFSTEFRNSPSLLKRPPFEVLKKQVEEIGYRNTGLIYDVKDGTIRKWLVLYYEELNIEGEIPKKLTRRETKQKSMGISFEILKSDIEEMGHLKTAEKHNIMHSTLKRWIDDYLKRNPNVERPHMKEENYSHPQAKEKVPFELLKIDIEELGYRKAAEKNNIGKNTLVRWIEEYLEKDSSLKRPQKLDNSRSIKLNFIEIEKDIRELGYYGTAGKYGTTFQNLKDKIEQHKKDNPDYLKGYKTKTASKMPKVEDLLKDEKIMSKTAIAEKYNVHGCTVTGWFKKIKGKKYVNKTTSKMPDDIKELKKDFKTMTNMAIAEKYGVSDSAVGRWAKKLNIVNNYLKKPKRGKRKK